MTVVLRLLVLLMVAVVPVERAEAKWKERRPSGPPEYPSECPSIENSTKTHIVFKPLPLTGGGGGVGGVGGPEPALTTFVVSAEKFRKRVPALLRTLHEAKLSSAELLLYKDEPTTRPPEIYKTPPYKWLAHCLYAGVHAPGQKEAPKKIVPWLPICNPSALKWRPLPELYRCFSYAAFNGLTHLAAVSEILVRNLPYALILEDDIVFSDGGKALLAHLGSLDGIVRAFVRDDTDILHLGGCHNFHFHQMGWEQVGSVKGVVEIGGDGGGGGGGGPLHVSVDRSPMHSRNGSRCAHAYLLSHRGATRWLTEHPKLINHIDHHFDAMHYKTSINVDFVEPPLLCQTKEHLWRGSRQHPAHKKAC